MAAQSSIVSYEQPNPGSLEAQDAGCICAIVDNNHGKFPAWHGGWWITSGCPLHDPDDTDDD